MNIFKRMRIIYILHRHAIKHQLWKSVSEKLFLFQRGMRAVEKAHLRELSTQFLYKKNIFGVQGLQITDEMRVIIAAQACLLILKLDFEFFNGWTDVIIYPGAFRVSRDEIDEVGVVHHGERILRNGNSITLSLWRSNFSSD
jgi:Mlc titration factor MtfA (ptsG expression regulator)